MNEWCYGQYHCAFSADVWLVWKGLRQTFSFATSVHCGKFWPLFCWVSVDVVAQRSAPSQSHLYLSPFDHPQMQSQWTQKTLFQFRDFCTFFKTFIVKTTLNQFRWINNLVRPVQASRGGWATGWMEQGAREGLKQIQASEHFPPQYSSYVFSVFAFKHKNLKWLRASKTHNDLMGEFVLRFFPTDYKYLA